MYGKRSQLEFKILDGEVGCLKMLYAMLRATFKFCHYIELNDPIGSFFYEWLKILQNDIRVTRLAWAVKSDTVETGEPELHSGGRGVLETCYCHSVVPCLPLKVYWQAYAMFLTRQVGGWCCVCLSDHGEQFTKMVVLTWWTSLCEFWDSARRKHYGDTGASTIVESVPSRQRVGFSKWNTP